MLSLRIWFSPDDTVVMIIAAASDKFWPNKTENFLAHFIGTTSGETIKMLRFHWPQKSVSLVPYGAEIVESNGKNQILFSLEGKVISQVDSSCVKN